MLRAAESAHAACCVLRAADSLCIQGLQCRFGRHLRSRSLSYRSTFTREVVNVGRGSTRRMKSLQSATVRHPAFGLRRVDVRHQDLPDQVRSVERCSCNQVAPAGRLRGDASSSYASIIISPLSPHSYAYHMPTSEYSFHGGVLWILMHC